MPIEQSSDRAASVFQFESKDWIDRTIVGSYLFTQTG
jgi:hypothetical protein